MKVICIDDSPGFQSMELPPFKEGDILDAAQSPFHELDYLIAPDIGSGWHKKRFIPLSDKQEERVAELELEIFAFNHP